MKSSFDRNAGIALLISIFLMLFTMIHHPVGGDIEYLLRIRKIIIITHAVALFSVPFTFVGFWGLTRKLGADNIFSITAFSFISFGLVAVIIAAGTNGLIIPIFIERYKGATPEVLESAKHFLRYSFAINRAFDYILTVAFCVAMVSWSIAILQTKKLPVWIGWFGILLAVVVAILGLTMSSLKDFQVFVSGILLWIVLIAVLLIRAPKE